MRRILTLLVFGVIGSSVLGQTNIKDENNTTTPIYIKNENVGIGISDPIAKFEIYNSLSAAGVPGFVLNNTYANKGSEPEDNRPFVIRRFHYDSESLRTYLQDAKLHFLYQNDESVGCIEFRIKNTDTEYGGGAKANDLAILKLVSNSVGGHLAFAGGVRMKGSFSPDEAYYKNDNYISFGDPGTSEDFIGYKSNTFYFKDCIGGGDKSDPSIVVGGNITSEKGIYASSLEIAGIVRAEEILVEANGQTADFVFSDSYQLRNLSELENYILTHKHLPDIPSATEMEEQGVNLVEMNKLLLQKVEELTLYQIAKNKEVRELKDARNKEKKEREKLENELVIQGEKLNELDALIKRLITN
ncbi:hypothetical protein, partial [Saccharicrinis fermentans]